MEEVKLELVCKGWAEKRARCSTGGKHWVCNEPLGGGRCACVAVPWVGRPG